MFFNIMYLHSMEHGAVRLLSKHYDILTNTSYKFFGIGPSSYVELALEDHRGRIITLSRSMEGLLRATMEYLQDASKRMQE